MPYCFPSFPKKIVGAILLRIFVLAFFATAFLPAAAQNLIWNGAYAGSPLNNPVNDAADMATNISKNQQR